MDKLREEKNYKALENKNQLRKLEEFYVNAHLDNINEIINKKREQIVGKLEEFKKNNIEEKVDKYGNVNKIVNPYLISTYFFKSINPLTSKTPAYSAEKLSLVWDLYMHLIEQVNIQIAPFQPTLTHFAKFAGISLNTLSNYKTCGDEDMMTLCDKIYDECFNGNISLAQAGKLREKSTMSRLKIENQVVEKVQPQVKVNVETKIDLDEINKRLEEIRKFNTKVIDLDKKKKK